MLTTYSSPLVISIPDIEAHIHNELSLSPSPTCRRVGIPFPTKSKSGVSIPPHHQRARKQVQIFESQPLASPRSTGSAAPVVSMSVPTQLEAHNVASTSQNGSYVAQMHFTRTGNCLSGTVGSLSSNGKLASLAASAQHTESSLLQKRTDVYAAKGITAVPPRVFNSPSTSSSSSSISSALASTTPGSSSLVSTATNVIVKFSRKCHDGVHGTGKLASELSNRSKLSPGENKGLFGASACQSGFNSRPEENRRLRSIWRHNLVLPFLHHGKLRQRSFPIRGKTRYPSHSPPTSPLYSKQVREASPFL